MKKSLLFGALLALPLAASAEGLSYNYVQLDWVADTELENGGSVDGDGFDLGGVFSFNENFYVLGNYEDVTYDGNGGDLEVTTLSLGVGGHSNTYTGAIDIFGNLTFEDLELEIGGLSGDDSGLGVEIGARTALGANADGYISYKFTDIDDAESDFFKLGGNYMFTPNWAITAEYRTGEYDGFADRDDLRVGVRYNF